MEPGGGEGGGGSQCEMSYLSYPVCYQLSRQIRATVWAEPGLEPEDLQNPV